MKPIWVMLAGWLIALAPLAAEPASNFPFQVGEKLSYQIYWGPFTGGRAVLEVEGIEKVDGQDCYHLVASAQTSGLADFLFHIVIKNESWLDVNTLQTRRYREERAEGKRRRADDSHYDYVSGKVVTTNFVTGRLKSAPLSGPVQDMVSCFYFVRTRNLQLDVEHKFPVDVTGARYDVTIRPDERKTMFCRPLGDIQALRVEPTPTLSVVAANNGRMWFWISDDDRKLPIVLSSDMKIGSAKFILTDVKLGESKSKAKSGKTATNSTVVTPGIAHP